MARKHPLPEFLRAQGVEEKAFCRWLHRKACAHVRRDRKRGYKNITAGPYRERIYQAVLEATGRDFFTGEALDWRQISKWANEEAANGRGVYKRKFWNIPTVDHEDPSNPGSPLRLCSWRVNDTKNDQTIIELLALADLIRAHTRC